MACSAEGAALCYRSICAEADRLLGSHIHPQISLHGHSLADYVTCIERDDWDGVGDLMLSSTEKLRRAGAEFVICPDNTIHQSFKYVQFRSPLPWLHIAEVVAQKAQSQQYQCLGLTGTQWLVESEVYPEHLAAKNIRYIRPTEAQRSEINRIIMQELVKGEFKPESVNYFQQVIKQLQEQGCDAVVLGCTEIPLIIDDANSSLPTLNSTVLLAQAALAHALE